MHMMHVMVGVGQEGHLRTLGTAEAETVLFTRVIVIVIVIIVIIVIVGVGVGFDVLCECWSVSKFACAQHRLRTFPVVVVLVCVCEGGVVDGGGGWCTEMQCAWDVGVSVCVCTCFCLL